MHGKDRPKDPPSVWHNVPLSQIPTPLPASRSTKRSLSSVRSREEDQLAAFLAKDRVTFIQLKEILLTRKRDLQVSVIAFMDDSVSTIQSTRFMNGMPMFVVRISQDLSFENFHLGVKCSSLSQNPITTMQSWSALEENLRFLNNVV